MVGGLKSMPYDLTDSTFRVLGLLILQRLVAIVYLGLGLVVLAAMEMIEPFSMGIGFHVRSKSLLPPKFEQCACIGPVGVYADVAPHQTLQSCIGGRVLGGVKEKKSKGYGLLEAVRSHDPAKVRRLLARGADGNCKEASSGSTPLHLAIGSPAIVRLLLAVDGIDVNAVDNSCSTPLHLARGHRVPGLLLAVDGIDVNAADNSCSTPLHLAIGSPAIVRLLLAVDGIDVNAVDNSGKTPLHLARNLEVVQLLLAVDGIDVNAVDSNGNTPLHVVLHFEDVVALHRGGMIAKLLLAVKGIDVNATNNVSSGSGQQQQQ